MAIVRIDDISSEVGGNVEVSLFGRVMGLADCFAIDAVITFIRLDGQGTGIIYNKSPPFNKPSATAHT
jgi:hypothetical protein